MIINFEMSILTNTKQKKKTVSRLHSESFAKELTHVRQERIDEIEKKVDNENL